MPPSTEGGLLPSPDTCVTTMIIDPGCRAICFDMDGTLLNTKVDYVRMAELIFDALERQGVPPEIVDRTQAYKLSVDSGFDWLRANGRGNEVYEVGDAISEAARDVEMERVDEAVPFPGVPEMLRRIREKGYMTGVLTRGCREYAEAALRISGVRDLLDAVVARDDFPESEAKPSPVAMKHMADAVGVSPAEILYMGDHKYDWMCAVDSSAKFVAVTSGTYSEADWRELDPDMTVFGTVAELSAYL